MKLLSLLLPALPAVANAQFTFTTNNGAITTTGYTGNPTVLNIPNTTNGYPITSIGDSAFQYCMSLTSVTIGANVTSVGAGAFNDCSALTNVTMGTNVISIGTFAFDACSILSSVTIPKSVTNIEIGAFAECPKLAGITVVSNNPAYVSVNGVIFNHNRSTLVEYSEGNTQKNYTISNSVTDIGPYAFFFCTSLTNITISSSTTNIEEQAFIDCFGLTGITIPNSVTTVGAAAFAGCPLNSVTIGDKVAIIESSAFENTSLSNIMIPKSVTTIGAVAFGYTSLSSVTIPNSVTNFDGSAFEGCPNLTSITVAGGNPSYESVGGVVFNNNLTTLVEYPSGIAGSFTISNSITSIGEGAFFGCVNLSSVTIPNSVTNIGADAFASCSSLNSITIPRSVISLGNLAFLDCDGLAQVYFQGNVPSVVDEPDLFLNDHNVTVYYLPGTTGWSSFSTNVKVTTVSWNPQAQTSGTSFGVQTNRFGFNITGSSNLVIVVEACANLSNPVWQPVQTNTLNTFVGTNGTSYFSDPQWTNYPTRFYRIRSPY